MRTGKYKFTILIFSDKKSRDECPNYRFILLLMVIIAIVVGGKDLNKGDNKSKTTIGLILGNFEIVISGILIPWLILMTL